ncbi:hypothetical protein A2U01_0079060, partial [Trifolium medium]|nr:hypothetical protein [Trifolium medium]
MVGNASVSCASRRQEWHVVPVSKDRAPELSAICASHRFIRRIAHLHLFFTRVAQQGGAARSCEIYIRNQHFQI